VRRSHVSARARAKGIKSPGAHLLHSLLSCRSMAPGRGSCLLPLLLWGWAWLRAGAGAGGEGAAGPEELSVLLKIPVLVDGKCQCCAWLNLAKPATIIIRESAETFCRSPESWVEVSSCDELRAHVRSNAFAPADHKAEKPSDISSTFPRSFASIPDVEWLGQTPLSATRRVATQHLFR
jgi:hypothetical protein